ncbi:MAG TPA: hypothetical protein VMT27_01730 [Actinomycetes bacterium]|nr:hypothetical protein [Actinomycetes bacterium]
MGQFGRDYVRIRGEAHMDDTALLVEGHHFVALIVTGERFGDGGGGDRRQAAFELGTVSRRSRHRLEPLRGGDEEI